MFHKGISTVINGDSSDGSWEKYIVSLLEGTHHSRYHFRNAFFFFFFSDSWEEVQISTLTGVWKKLIPNLMVNFSAGRHSRCDKNSKRNIIRSGS